MMPRPIEALIHPLAYAHNLARARAAAPDAKVWAVVKADAYGHGIDRLFPALTAADGIAVLDLDEAQRLRARDWRGPILLLEGAFGPRDLELCSQLGLWHVVHQEAQIDWLAWHKTHQGHRVFLKLQSGMQRLGFAPDAFRSAYARLSALPQVEEISLMTHYANADQAAGLQAPWRLFEAACEGLSGERSLANSAAVLLHGPSLSRLGDWIRPGILCFGSSPDHPTHTAAHWQLQPTMTLRTHLIAVQHLQAGDAVGYGGQFVAQEAMRVGIAACGYADGYPRHAPCNNTEGAPVLVDGLRSRTLGRVSMDMLTVDLRGIPQAAVGTEVTLWGRGPRGSVLPIDEVAHAAGTVGYELMCALAKRVPVSVTED
jgi:alanine racemase